MNKVHLTYANAKFSDSAFSALLGLHFNACPQRKALATSRSRVCFFDGLSLVILYDGTIAKLVRLQPAKLPFAGSSPASSSKTVFYLYLDKIPLLYCREMSEWSNVPVLKTGEGYTSGGSNPPLPAIN